MDDLKETINHFTHPHPLKLVQLGRVVGRQAQGFTCYCCESVCSEPYWNSDCASSSKYAMYACGDLKCNPFGIEVIGRIPHDAYLCLSCAELGESVKRNALHPHHPRLKLRRSLDRYSGYRKCSACCGSIYSEFSYHCEEEKCNFEMHVRCAHSMNPTLSLPSHSHLLSLAPGHGLSQSKCESCHSDIPYFTTFARCVPCNLNYHISCRRVNYSLPDLVTDVQRHPQHLLSLTRTDSHWSCDVCFRNKRERKGVMVYACLDCDNFTAHVSCIFRSSWPCPFSNLVTKVVLPDLITKDGPMQERVTCQRCNKCILNNNVYGCQYCRFFLHETCISRATVDEKVEENFIFSHPGYDLEHKYPLILVFVHGAVGYRCACCEKKCIGFVFQKKDDASFVLHLECMSVESSLKLIGHDHTIALLQRSNTTKSSYLRCIPCRKDFSIADSSFRFPRSVLHECHFHPLTLVQRRTENFECYCDVCEDKREPGECIYYCVECKFEAHIACVKSEVIALCANKPEDVTFVTLQEVTRGEQAREEKVGVKKDFILSLELQLWNNIHVDKEIDGIFETASKTTWRNSVRENLSYSDEFLSRAFYSDKPFQLFIQELDLASTIEKARSTLESLKCKRVVRVGEYFVPFDFDEVIETLFDKYGDVGEKCTCSQEVKQCIFVGLCKALQIMCETKVEHVTKSLLMEWWAWFAIGKAAGFQIQFALEILERVVYAYFGLEADKYANGKLTKVRKKIREIPEETNELRRKLEELNKELRKKEMELEEAITEEKELREVTFREKKSHLMRKCLTEAEDLGCYYVIELLFSPEKDCDSV